MNNEFYIIIFITIMQINAYVSKYLLKYVNMYVCMHNKNQFRVYCIVVAWNNCSKHFVI